MMGDGGPAFPVTNEQSYDGISASQGMSLRDFFAAGAMQGWLASFPGSYPHPGVRFENARSLARYSYVIADAMIAEREKQ